MKRIIGLAAVLMMAIAILVPMAAFAANGNGALGHRGANSEGCLAAESQPCFVDADGDGICDNRSGEASQQGKRNHMHGRNASDGIACPGYVDEDSDGICDNCGKNRRGKQLRDGSGAADGTGHGRGYVDENGDRICDNRQ